MNREIIGPTTSRLRISNQQERVINQAVPNEPVNLASEAVPGALELDVTWQTRSSCDESTAEMFFSDEKRIRELAKAVCDRCVVRDECLDYALENGEAFGIWGGLSEPERLRLSRSRY